MKNSMINLSVGDGRTKLEYEISFVGSDLFVSVCGGDAHIGSVAVAIPRQSLADNSENSATTSTINITGHKDDILTNPLAHLLAKAFECTCVVAGGFHLDDISEEEMVIVLRNSDEATSIIIDAIKNELMQ